ncbi:MAG: hypothetical protein E7517_00075 [Ruminococcaceae bacterium]|nr:hypothetical protein [Oscillospiraceae bacterium]
MSMPGRDIICVDGEYKVVIKKTVNYISELCDAICEYNKVLAVLQKTGIIDEQIRGKLGELADTLNAYHDTLNEISTSLETDKRVFLEAISKNDTFTFPI